MTFWRPGAHVLLSIPRFGIMQSHPATISSTPRTLNGDLVFILKSHKGFTKRIMAGANNSRTTLLPHSKGESESGNNAEVTRHIAIIDGPYGGSQSDFAAFDSACLIAGSTGVTFTMAILQYLGDRAALGGEKLAMRNLHFVWCVKSTSWASWVNKEIAAACGKLEGAGIDARVSIYVTCADNFTEQGNEPKECGCDCDTSNGKPCCCVNVDESSDGDEVEDITPVQKSTNTARTNEKVQLLPSEARCLPILPRALFYSGRPQIREILTDMLENADGESGVAVCGPVGLNSAVRNSVVRLSDERAIHKGTGAQGCYLHVESFC